MNEYLTFRKMITPVFIQIIFWIAVVAIVIGGLAAIANDNAGAGILVILIGPLVARIYAEILIVIFRINDNVGAIRYYSQAKAAPLPTPPPPPTQTT